MWGRGREGAMAPAPLSTVFQSLPPLPTIKLGPSGAGSQVGGPVHTLGPCGSLQRPLPVRLRVSPAAAPTPTGVFNQRSEALFPCAGALGYVVCFAPRCSTCPVLHHSESGPLGLSVRELGATGSASGQTAFPFRHQSGSHHGHASPLCPGAISAPPTGLDVCFFFIYLVSDFPAIRFSVSSGCSRRRSVSTYAAILVLPIWNKLQ